jgi:hypothetical protein
MGTVRKEVQVDRSAAEVWDAVRDFGAPGRVVPGFVVAAELEGRDRVVTFASGAVARERLVTLDDERRRLVYTIVESPLGFEHYQGSVEVVDWGPEGGCLIIWTVDFLPDEVAGVLDGIMDQGADAMAGAFGG